MTIILHCLQNGWNSSILVISLSWQRLHLFHNFRHQKYFWQTNWYKLKLFLIILYCLQIGWNSSILLISLSWQQLHLFHNFRHQKCFWQNNCYKLKFLKVKVGKQNLSKYIRKHNWINYYGAAYIQDNFAVVNFWKVDPESHFRKFNLTHNFSIASIGLHAIQQFFWWRTIWSILYSNHLAGKSKN